MLVEADPRGEWEVGTHAHEHPAPAVIIQVEVELVHPALLVLQVGAVVALVSNGHQNASRFPRFEDRHHLVGFGILEVRIQEPIAPTLVALAFGRLQNWRAPFFGSVLHPVLELVGDLRQGLSGHPLAVAVGVEETEHALRLLERLDQSIEQKSIEASIGELNAILVVLEKGVHGNLPGVRYLEHTPVNALLAYAAESSGPEFSRPAGVAQSA